MSNRRQSAAVLVMCGVIGNRKSQAETVLAPYLCGSAVNL
jgi:hypothetical protein